MATTLLGQRRIRTVTVIPDDMGPAGAWAFDVVMNMNETSPGQAFRHPLQNGHEGITDGVRLEPETFSVSGLTSDTPIRWFVPGPHKGAAALYEQIKAIRRRQKSVTVITSWAGVLTGRWPEVIQGTHGAQQGASIDISIDFVKFNIVFDMLMPLQVDADVLLLGAQTVIAQQM